MRIIYIYIEFWHGNPIACAWFHSVALLIAVAARSAYREDRLRDKGFDPRSY